MNRCLCHGICVVEISLLWKHNWRNRVFEEKNQRWHFPTYYFAVEKLYKYVEDSNRFDEIKSQAFEKSDKDNIKILIVSLDTWRLNGGYTFVQFDPVSGTSVLIPHEGNKSLPYVTVARRLGIVEKSTDNLILSKYRMPPDRNQNRNIDDEQLQWLNKTLKESLADFKIVLGHFPVFSAFRGEHGDTANLIKCLYPILVENKVDAYINGHDHILQHISKGGV
mmetsp:Transcript_14563/g.17995  ORF Transcript_14563/g.17995 Transcript_14563/m.17995 type:complete len:222 (-) Transcript_14563:658-1323(-)